MAKRIDVYHNDRLKELDFSKGELILLDGGVDDITPPLVLGHIGFHMFAKYPTIDGGLRLLFQPSPPDIREEKTAYFEGNVVGLYSPHLVNGKLQQNLVPFNRIPNPYVVETAVAGREGIIKYLEEHREKDLAFYAQCLKDGKLITERGRLGKIAEELGLGSFLPDRIRFRR